MKHCGINLTKDVQDTKNYKTLTCHILVHKTMLLIKVIQKRVDVICLCMSLLNIIQWILLKFSENVRFLKILIIEKSLHVVHYNIGSLPIYCTSASKFNRKTECRCVSITYNITSFILWAGKVHLFQTINSTN